MSDGSPPSGPVAVLARVPALPGKRDELVAALQAAIDNANTEADTLLYILHTNDADPDAVLFYELYTERGSLRRPRHQRRLQGDRSGPARPRRRSTGDHAPDAGHRQGAVAGDVPRSHRRPPSRGGGERSTARSTTLIERCPAMVRRRAASAGPLTADAAAGRDRRDQAAVAVEGGAQPGPRPGGARPYVRRRRCGVPVGADRRRVLRRLGRRPAGGAAADDAAGAAQGLHRVGPRRRRRPADGRRRRAADRRRPRPPAS